jgi:hypothetical protein
MTERSTSKENVPDNSGTSLRDAEVGAMVIVPGAN